MDITEAIAKNLVRWMSNNSNLDTIKKLSTRSKVGFGTIQRARNGDGNITVQKLEAIAHAFGKRAMDLVSEPLVEYEQPSTPAPFVSENITALPKQDPLAGYINDLVALAIEMDDQGRWQLIGQAKLLANTNPKAKANPAS